MCYLGFASRLLCAQDHSALVNSVCFTVPRNNSTCPKNFYSGNHATLLQMLIGYHWITCPVIPPSNRVQSWCNLSCLYAFFQGSLQCEMGEAINRDGFYVTVGALRVNVPSWAYEKKPVYVLASPFIYFLFTVILLPRIRGLETSQWDDPLGHGSKKYRTILFCVCFGSLRIILKSLASEFLPQHWTPAPLLIPLYAHGWSALVDINYKGGSSQFSSY